MEKTLLISAAVALMGCQPKTDNDTKATIYVTKGKTADAQPEFIRVDR